MRSTTNTRLKYETELAMRQRHGEELTPFELQRLAAGRKRLRRDFLVKLGIAYSIAFPILGALLYRALHTR